MIQLMPMTRMNNHHTLGAWLAKRLGVSVHRGFGLVLLLWMPGLCLRLSCQTPTTPAYSGIGTGPKGYALVIGVELVQGQTGVDAGTQGSGTDAREMYGILKKRGFDPGNMHLLITEQARADSIKSIMYRLAGQMTPADLFVLYFSGHGGQVADMGRLDEIDDHEDETIRCFDRELIDDTLLLAFQQMPSLSRIVFINDACNSGTTYKIFGGTDMKGVDTNKMTFNIAEAVPFIVPFEPLDQEQLVDSLNAQLIYLGGARDGEFSQGWPRGGEFTLALREALALPYLSRNYYELFKHVSHRVSRWQIPTYGEMGPVQNTFRQQTPFTIQP